MSPRPEEVHMRRRSALALLLPLIAAVSVSTVDPAVAARHNRHDRHAERHPIARGPAAWDLRLNEVDYDQPGFDADEFVEIVNLDAVRHRLRRIALVLVNGTTSKEYRRIPLSGRLGPSKRLVMASGTVAVDPAARTLPLPLSRDNVQNGAPDGILLLDVRDGAVLDALSYEGSIDHAVLDGVTGTVTLVHGHPVSETDDNEVAGSLCRRPDRADTGDDDDDWSRCAPTPGGPNGPPGITTDP
jgi:hypothetical protein